MANNAINNKIGSSANTNPLEIEKSASGEMINFDDQTDVHGYFSGAGSPEGVLAADIGSYYTDTGAGATGVYYKTTDTANTGWVLLSTAAGSGKVLQNLTTTFVAFATSAAVIPRINVRPTTAMGLNILNQAITPTNAANNILIIGTIMSTNNAGLTGAALFISGNANAIFMEEAGEGFGSGAEPLVFSYQEPALSTTVRTYSVNCAPVLAGIVNINGAPVVGALYGGASICTLNVQEISP